jgi:HAD superfamily hydrolase (TIGR01509 family)
LAAAEAIGLNLPMSVYLGIVGLPSPHARDHLLAHFEGNIDVDAVWAKASELFNQLVATDLRMKPGLLELLSFLDEQGIPSAIVTSSSRVTVDEHLTAVALHHKFEVVVARGDYSTGKPHPMPYLMAAEKIGRDISECLALEDSHNGVLSASSAGAMTIMVPDLLQPTDDIRSRCVCVLENLDKVRSMMVGNTAGT